jgi:hypothetical protein
VGTCDDRLRLLHRERHGVLLYLTFGAPTPAAAGLAGSAI